MKINYNIHTTRSRKIHETKNKTVWSAVFLHLKSASFFRKHRITILYLVKNIHVCCICLRTYMYVHVVKKKETVFYIWAVYWQHNIQDFMHCNFQHGQLQQRISSSFHMYLFSYCCCGQIEKCIKTLKQLLKIVA